MINQLFLHFLFGFLTDFFHFFILLFFIESFLYFFKEELFELIIFVFLFFFLFFFFLFFLVFLFFLFLFLELKLKVTFVKFGEVKAKFGVTRSILLLDPSFLDDFSDEDFTKLLIFPPVL